MKTLHLLKKLISGAMTLTDDELITIYHEIDHNEVLKELLSWHTGQEGLLEYAEARLAVYDRLVYRPVQQLNMGEERRTKTFQLAARSGEAGLQTPVEIATYSTQREGSLIRVFYDRATDRMKVLVLDAGNHCSDVAPMLLSIPALGKCFLSNPPNGFTIDLSAFSDELLVFEPKPGEMMNIRDRLLEPGFWQNVIIHTAIMTLPDAGTSGSVPNYEVHRTLLDGSNGSERPDRAIIEFRQISEDELPEADPAKTPSDIINILPAGSGLDLSPEMQPSRVGSLVTGEVFYLNAGSTLIHTTPDAVAGSWAFYL